MHSYAVCTYFNYQGKIELEVGIDYFTPVLIELHE